MQDAPSYRPKLNAVHLSRRTFAGLLAAGAVGLIAGALGALDSLRGLRHRLDPLALDDAPTGPINTVNLRTLLAATRAVVNEPIEGEHYAAFFRWRAERLRGHLALYDRFHATVNQMAERAEGRAFAECLVATQRRILQRVFEARTDATTMRRPRRGDRDWLLYDRYIVRDVLALFARTDVWTLLGYETWSGTPRGLDRYREVPRRKA